jgi:hypothetical protein
MDQLKETISKIANEFDEKLIPLEWKNIYRYDKGKLDEDADFAKKVVAESSYK